MKNEKFCFSKGTGLIALVGIVLVGLVIVMTNLPSTNTTTKAGSRAKWCKYAQGTFTTTATTVTFGTHTYTVNTGTGCITESGVNTGAKCTIVSADFTNTNAVNDSVNCPVPTAGPVCLYGGVSATVDADFCVLVGSPAAKNGYKCRTSGSPAALVAGRNSAVKDTTGTCAAPVGAPSCWYNQTDVSGDASTGAAGATGCISSVPGYKCRVTAAGALVAGKNSAVKDTVTCPVAAAAGVCLYGGVSATVDANFCVTVGGVKNGYICRTSGSPAALVAGRNSAFKDRSGTCVAPAAPGRTQCSWGDKLLTAGTDVQSGAQVLNIDATGCIQVDGYNNGYLCNAGTEYRSVRNLGTCPL